MTSEPIHETIARLREARGMTQSELARRAGTTQSAVSMIESGERTPSWGMAEKLAATLGVSVSFGGRAAPPAAPHEGRDVTTDEAREALNAMHGLSYGPGSEVTVPARTLRTWWSTLTDLLAMCYTMMDEPMEVRAAPPAETGAKGAVGDLLDAVGNALHLPDHPDVAKAFARVGFMYASPCSCWEDAMNRYRRGRAAWVGCSCLDHDPKERCDCPFCSLIHRGPPPAGTGECEALDRLNRYITTVEQTGGMIALGAGVLVDLHNDIADARAAIVRMYRQALATPVDPPTGPMDRMRESWKNSLPVDPPTGECETETPKQRLLSRLADERAARGECDNCGSTGLVPRPTDDPSTHSFDPCPDCPGDREGEVDPRDAVDAGLAALVEELTENDCEWTAKDVAEIRDDFRDIWPDHFPAIVSDPTGDAPGGENDDE